jgi:hypothetical protein
METETVVCEGKCGRYRVDIMLQRGTCRGILVVVTLNLKYSRGKELNAHTLTGEEFFVYSEWLSVVLAN